MEVAALPVPHLSRTLTCPPLVQLFSFYASSSSVKSSLVSGHLWERGFCIPGQGIDLQSWKQSGSEAGVRGG